MSHAKASTLRSELVRRGGGTVPELAARTGWPEATVKGALRLLGDAGEVDYEVRSGEGRTPVKHWVAQESEC